MSDIAPEKNPAGNPGEPENCPQEFSIVGIGASAGGLEACSALLKHLSPDTGFGFVVVQHLDPHHESLLPELLARATKIPVTKVTDEVPVQPNHIYVMPPNTEMVFRNGQLHLTPRNQVTDGPRLPIDAFFRSLAENCRHRAIGVILSGTGSDGALGLEMIKSEGGFTFAQDTLSAKFGGMPHSAFATGSVDFVLPPEGIARELAKISKYPYAERIEKVAGDADAGPEKNRLSGILAVLHQASGVDFSQYRPSTIQRRILRRMAIHHIAEMDKYRSFLESTPTEIAILCEEMIPSVTKFFRDPEVFVTLKDKVFKQILADRKGDDDSPVRIWVPGCASGEEVYAIAICLLEFREDNNAVFPIQIFGTDLSAIGIQKARQGRYPEGIAEDISAERLRRFFTKRESGWQIAASVREVCVFAIHDLIGDPTYSKLDLISCRNVLIYLDTVQTRIVPMFHYALKPGGFLVLGAMESARRFSDLFAPIDRHSQIYAKKAVTHRELLSWGLAKAVPLMEGRAASDSWDDASLQKKADRAALAMYSPGGVVVNENWQVLQIRGKISPFLEPAPGKMSASILALAKTSGLSQDLAAVLDKAKKENRPVRSEKIFLPHEEITVDLQVIPFVVDGDSRAYLVLFEESPAVQIAVLHNADGDSLVQKNELIRAQEELTATRERLATMLDNYQQYTEETQSAQEESLSNLEEIQSFNEELETTKEELQSTNEELSTVNEELQNRNSDLQEARDFTASIVETVQQPLVVLDSGLCVKTANRVFFSTFHLTRNETEGRSLFDLAEGAWNAPEFRAQLEKVLPENKTVEGFELVREFPKFGSKILNMNARRLNGGEMILVSIEDVSALRRVQEELRQGQKMEAIGRLAGGVAHDFNNLLTAIIGFSDLLQDGLPKNSDSWEQAGEIRRAGERAGTLTKQLLAFSRRQVLRPRSLDLNSVVQESDRLLRRLIGENIELTANLADDLWRVHADPGQISQVIINLALNSRDAMPNGGVLIVSTENTVVKEPAAAETAEEPKEPLRGLKPGNYVTLSISDSGEGMDVETQRHVFEPFFTTKPQGSGTGLGLATVYGIVDQSGASIHFKSELGSGTTFWIDMPQAEVSPSLAKPTEPAASPTGTETILVVEDEDMIRRLAVTALRRLGYKVLDAGRGGEGLALCTSHPSRIDLLLTDVVMPGGMNGRELAEKALAVRPRIKVVLMSGHTTDALVHFGVQHGAPFLQKPFTLHQLATKIREILDEKS